MSNIRKNTIKYVLPNLRGRWPALKEIEDDQLAQLYEEFSSSDEFGNNDEKFPLWVKDTFDLTL